VPCANTATFEERCTAERGTTMSTISLAQQLSTPKTAVHGLDESRRGVLGQHVDVERTGRVEHAAEVDHALSNCSAGARLEDDDQVGQCPLGDGLFHSDSSDAAAVTADM